MDTITLTRPDDWHLHLRDNAQMQAVLADTATRFGRAIVMPNLKPPVTTAALAKAYRKRIIAALPPGSDFLPLMTLYLTDQTTAQDIRDAKASGFVHAVKYYPAGATTNSDAGTRDILARTAVLEEMQKVDLPLLVHGEVTDSSVDIFDRERVFVDRLLSEIVRRYPALRVIAEHITTEEAMAFVTAASPRVAATITPQHLLMSRNALFSGGLRPHHYCLPVLKREHHRRALLAAATSGNSKFFLGTDSAPHARGTKETACGCAGVYSAHAAIEFYAEAFDQVGALDKLEAFASFHGADFYGLPRNSGKITLRREPWTAPLSQPYADDTLIPLRAGETVGWRLVSD